MKENKRVRELHIVAADEGGYVVYDRTGAREGMYQPMLFAGRLGEALEFAAKKFCPEVATKSLDV